MSQAMAPYVAPMNREVMDGFGIRFMNDIEQYLDENIKSVSVGLPRCIRYDGYERCTPQEEFEEATKPRNNTRRFDLAKSSIYMVKYFFVFTDANGKEFRIPRHIYLPYVTDAGIMYLGGTRYQVVRVLSDSVFTPGHGTIFVRLTRDKNIVKRTYHTFIIDEKRETRYVTWCTIYRNPPDQKEQRTTRAMTTLAHYIFAKFGFTETFRRYCGFVPVVGGEEITEDTYPSSDWVICRSTKLPPSGFIEKFYHGTTIRLAIPRNQWTPNVEGLISGFYYVVDHFPSRFQPKKEYLDDVSLWKILIGHIVLSGNNSEQRLHSKISEHFESLDNYLDVVIKKKLEDQGIYLNDYYDLLNYIISHCNEMILQKGNNGLSVYGKHLEVLYYVLFDIISGFVTLNFRLNKQQNQRPLNYKDVTENFNRRMRMGAVFDLQSENAAVEPVNSVGDHKYLKITSVVNDQENTTTSKRKKKSHVTVGRKHHLDLSMVEFGSVLNFPKSTPTPIVRINPWANIDAKTGMVKPNPKFEALMEENRPFFNL